jgi:HK97 gp10 family phage protein
MQISFKAEGFEDLFKKMEDLRQEIGKGKTDRIWRDILTYAIEPVLQDAKVYAPHDTGQLADHIYMKAQKPQARDKASSTYQGEMYLARVTVSPIRDDSKMHTVLNKKGKFQTVWLGKRPVAISQEFGNGQTSPHPFLRPALQNNIENIQTRLAQAIMVQLDKWSKN